MRPLQRGQGILVRNLCSSLKIFFETYFTTFPTKLAGVASGLNRNTGSLSSVLMCPVSILIGGNRKLLTAIFQNPTELTSVNGDNDEDEDEDDDDDEDEFGDFGGFEVSQSIPKFPIHEAIP